MPVRKEGLTHLCVSVQSKIFMQRWTSGTYACAWSDLCLCAKIFELVLGENSASAQGASDSLWLCATGIVHAQVDLCKERPLCLCARSL